MKEYHFKEIFKELNKAAKTFKQPIVTEIANVRRDPYQVLISCILSLRTKDKTTEEASVRLFKLADNPRKMLKLSLKQVEKAIYPVGFYITKAKRIQGINKILIKDYKEKVPKDFDKLMEFKGVGRKTANIVMVYGFNEEGMPIDVHCNRIPNRLGWIKTKNPEETEKVMRKILPKEYWHDFNDLFVQFGQNICVPVSPFCSKCPIREYCRRIGVKISR